MHEDDDDQLLDSVQALEHAMDVMMELHPHITRPFLSYVLAGPLGASLPSDVDLRGILDMALAEIPGADGGDPMDFDQVFGADERTAERVYGPISPFVNVEIMKLARERPHLASMAAELSNNDVASHVTLLARLLSNGEGGQRTAIAIHWFLSAREAGGPPDDDDGPRRGPSRPAPTRGPRVLEDA